MILRDRLFGFALIACAVPALGQPPSRTAAPLEIPHATNLDLDFKTRKHSHRPDNVESSQLFESAPGLEPLIWPRNGDMRARLVTPGLRRTPVIGWIASNL